MNRGELVRLLNTLTKHKLTQSRRITCIFPPPPFFYSSSNINLSFSNLTSVLKIPLASFYYEVLFTQWICNVADIHLN